MNKRYNKKAGNMSYTGHTHDHLYCWEIMTTFLLEAIKALELNTHLKEELTKHTSSAKFCFSSFQLSFPATQLI